MPLFDKRSDIPRSQFRNILKKTDIKVGNKQFSSREKAMMEKRDFPKRFGPSISESEYARTINRLKSEKMKEQDFTRKIKTGRDIKFLEALNKGEASSSSKPKVPEKPKDDSIFHGKREISRGEFRKGLRERYQGSNMSLTDRVRIEKEDFPFFYGGNISRSDLNLGTQKMYQKMMSEKDPQKRQVMRKKINYLKKLAKE